MRRVRVGFLSDLHLGTRMRVDLARRGDVRAAIAAQVRECDELVLLGDVLELRDRPLADVLDAATPFLAELGAALGNGRVVLVPGNHDHRLAYEAREADGSPSGASAALVHEVRRGARGPLGAIRDRLGVDLVVAYPGWRAADGVWATHGHYLDAHSAAPTLECVLSEAIGRLRRRPAARASAPADYEAVLAPTYRLYFEIAQRRRLDRLADGGKALVRAAETRLGTRGRTPGPARPRDGIGLGGDRLGTLPGEIRRPGVLPFARVLERLGVEADHVLFGHTHRTGPAAGDPPSMWRLPGGTALWNTGSWIFEPEFHGSAGSQSPYWPGTFVTLDGSGPPRLHRVLARFAPDI